MANFPKELEVEFKVQIEKLNQYLSKVRAEYPEAQLYLSSTGLSLINGPSHDDSCRPRIEAVLCQAVIKHITGGDW